MVPFNPEEDEIFPYTSVNGKVFKIIIGCCSWVVYNYAASGCDRMVSGIDCCVIARA